MATHTLTTSFIKDAFNGTTFDFSSGTSDVYKCALFRTAAALDHTTTAYAASNEASGTGYTAGGATLSIATNPTVDGINVYWTFSDVTWSSSTITAQYGLIYLADGSGNPSVAVIDLEKEYSTAGADFVLEIPSRLIQLTVARR